MPRAPSPPLTFVVPDALAGVRLDRALPEFVRDLTRAQARRLIDARHVTVNGADGKASRTLHVGDEVTVQPTDAPADGGPAPEAIPLDVVYEDDTLLVVNKPAGLVVHPAPGHPAGTLVNALLHHTAGALDGGTPDRPGIVHRLDKDTSGLLAVAKTAKAHAALAAQFAEHTVDRAYLALVWGTFTEARGTVDAPIGRAPADRTRMTITGIHSRRAVTHFTVVARFPDAAELRVELETGRTHQVRLHCRHMGHSVIGDPTYGSPPPRKRVAWPDTVWEAGRRLPGQMLHATRLGLTHPGTGETLVWEAPPPAQYTAFRELLAGLQESG